MDILLGAIILLPYTFTPTGMVECKGQQLPIERNQALFSLLGTTFGGDGRSNFALPDLSEKAPIEGMKYYIALEGIYPSRA